MRPFIDITGQVFGELTAIKLVRKELKPNSTKYNFFYEFLCSCGNKKVLNKNNVVRGTTFSCGCSREKHIKDLSGKKFGKLTVLKRNTDSNGKLLITYTCKCDCGDTTTTPEGRKLQNGIVKSCGCLRPSSDYVGDTFGRLLVIEKLKSKNRKSQYKCVCNCGNEVDLSISSLIAGTKSCGCILLEELQFEERRKKHSLRMTGENNHGWKGGVVFERPEAKVRIWRKAVYDRDFYTCKCCGEKGGKLNAHHILPYKTHVEDRFNVSNGITLCQPCHIDFHNTYGRKDFTLENLVEFMTKEEEVCFE